MNGDASDVRSRTIGKVEVVLFLFVVALAGPFVHDYGAQHASRYALTAAIWDDHTIELTEYADVLGIDRAVRDGRTYSDKAPLQPMLAVPAYATYRLVGGESAMRLRVEENLGLWWVTFWMSAIPLGLLAVLMYRFASRYSRWGLSASLGLALTTMLLPFGTELFGHELTALFLFGSLYLVTRDRVEPAVGIGAGLLAGAAVATEYIAAIGVVVLLGFVVWKRRRSLGWFVLGGIPFVLLLGWYHNAAFGSPLTHPYQYSAFGGEVTQAADTLGIFSSLHPERIVQVFFAGRGFLVASPLVVLALYGAGKLARDRSPERRAVGWLALIMFLGYLGIVVMWGNPWGGDSPGPRYMVPAIPVLAAGLAVVWGRWHLLSKAAFALGLLTMGVATVTDPLGIGRQISGGLNNWVALVIDGELAPTVFTMAFGIAGWAVHIALAGSLGYVLMRVGRLHTATAAARRDA